MELLQLKYFQTVAKLEHISKAAEELHIAQPALSKTIKLLEKNLGVELFDRKGKSIKLNKYGQVFLRRVNESLSALENGQRELEDLTNNYYPAIRLSILAGSSLIPELINLFRLKYPYIKFNLIQHKSLPINNTDFDLCISSSYFSDTDFTNYTLFTEKILLAIPYNHPLSNRKSINLYDIRNESFISLSKGSSLRLLTDSLCKSVGFTPNIVFESDNPSTVRELINAGIGISFVPSISWTTLNHSSLSLIKINDSRFSRKLTISIPKNRYLSKSTELFKNFIVEYFKTNLL